MCGYRPALRVPHTLNGRLRLGPAQRLQSCCIATVRRPRPPPAVGALHALVDAARCLGSPRQPSAASAAVQSQTFRRGGQTQLAYGRSLTSGSKIFDLHFGGRRVPQTAELDFCICLHLSAFVCISALSLHSDVLLRASL